MASNHTKGEKRFSVDADELSRKKFKKSDGLADDMHNPYLAHLHENGVADGFGPLAGMERHQTTVAQAAKAEDAAVNPFTGCAHSRRYFKILQTRRDLPVHKQR